MWEFFAPHSRDGFNDEMENTAGAWKRGCRDLSPDSIRETRQDIVTHVHLKLKISCRAVMEMDAQRHMRRGKASPSPRDGHEVACVTFACASLGVWK